MIKAFCRIKDNKKLILFAKAAVCLCVFFIIFKALSVNGLKPYCSYKDYSYKNDISDGRGVALDGMNLVEQSFVAKGNIIDSLTIYLGDISNSEIRLSVCTVDQTEIAHTLINADRYSSNAWNRVSGMNITNLERGKEYIIRVSGEDGLSPIVLSTEDASVIFKECLVENNRTDAGLAVGIQFTYRYLTLGSVFELIITVVFSLLMGMALCYSVIRFEKLYALFCDAKKKDGLWMALYFSVSFVLLNNPLETIKNEVSEFGRVIGNGIVNNVDVSKRIGNFTNWFILFAISFVLFYLLSNYIFHKNMREDGRKAADFLKNYMVLANCCLLLRCITYFNDESGTAAVYYFTDYAVMMAAIIAVAYIVMGLEAKISIKDYARLHFAAVSVSFPIAIIFALEWGKGRVLLGVWFIFAVLITLYCRFFIKGKQKEKIGRPLGAICLMCALLPLLTSMYIELIHVLNQYSVFVARPAKYYKIAMLLFFIAVAGIVLFIRGKKYKPEKLDGWAAPLFIFGVSCLAFQIPITSTYNPDMFEGANSSILLSSFFNFGSIPIVQHYGGHMMSFIWEGILYGIINGDFYGAAASPYGAIMEPFLAVLFYFLVKEVWDRRMAVFAALLFPFSMFWTVYGLGMLICVAAIAYVRKNTYPRAALLWAAVVWCVLYRLDLGFPFGIALVFAMLTYIIAEKNLKAAKELGITFAAWAVSGVVLWCAICLAKGIHPINRLIEFLQISMSNLNWGYAGIGDAGNTLFAWSYLLIPFMVTLGLLYTTFSKTMRERMGLGRWVLLLIMGWSYFGNFSRGLVRHSLVELLTVIVIWNAYLFLAMFISAYKDNVRLFLPVFMVLIICNMQLIQNENLTMKPIAENAVDKPGSIIESWEPARFSEEEYQEAKLEQDRLIASGGSVDKQDLLPNRYMTYWEQVKHRKKKIERVKYADSLVRYVNKYKLLTETLLKEDETFVDFINKTLIYSLLGKENPVYVSQSPLQLSGEFTQKEYIKEMTGVPLVLMPIDADNTRSSNSLDGITNLYRYYKVGENIFQNYVPLLQYGNDYAVWCLNDRLDEYKEKLSPCLEGYDYTDELVQSIVQCDNAKLARNAAGTVVMKSTGRDSKLTELQNLIDISGYIDGDMQICIEYTTDVDGDMQIFYTTDKGEKYTEDKVLTENITGIGTAYFTIPITKYSRLRLDIPDGSTVEIKSFIVKSPVKLIDYGYDGPNENAARNGSYDYIDALHNHSIGQLPRIWAESDKKNSVQNTVAAEAVFEQGVYTFEPDRIDKTNGNYCCLSVTYDGLDRDGLYESDDEQLAATVIMGNYTNGSFEEKCRYSISLKEGTHDYLIRCSTDYYWYLNQINALKIQVDDTVYDVSVKILEGD